MKQIIAFALGMLPFAALAAPFLPEEVRTRSQGARQVHYITARTAMNRLDQVLGPENWWDEYVPSANSVLCKLTIRLPDGSTVTKADARNAIPPPEPTPTIHSAACAGTCSSEIT